MEALKASALLDFSSMDMEGRAVLGHEQGGKSWRDREAPEHPPAAGCRFPAAGCRFPAAPQGCDPPQHQEWVLRPTAVAPSGTESGIRESPVELGGSRESGQIGCLLLGA